MKPLKPVVIVQKRYRLTKIIAQTTEKGNIYYGQDLQLSKEECVIKEILLDGLSEIEKSRISNRLFTEAMILSRLNHPNITKIRDYFVEGDKFYVVMEYVPGRTLAELSVQLKAPFEEKDVLLWGIQIASALSYLHLQRPKEIIFRDLCPSNILLTSDGTVKLVDFGLAKSPHEKTSPYDAPETKEEKKTIFDQKSNIYSLGAILHFLLTKREPLSNSPLLPVGSINAKIQPLINNIIEKATSTSREERHQDVLELKHDLQKSLDLLPDSSPAKFKGHPVKTKLPLVKIISIIALLAVLSVLAYYSVDFLKKNHQQAVTYRQHGINEYKAGNYQKSIEYFNKVIEIESFDGESYIYRQNAQLLLNKVKVVNVGVALPLTGESAYRGASIMLGLALAQEQLNNNPSIYRKIRLIIEDDYSTPSGAIDASMKLTSDSSVICVIGNVTSSTTDAALPVYNRASIVAFSPINLSFKEKNLGPYGFCLVNVIKDQPRFLAKLVASQFKDKKIAVLFNNYDAYYKKTALDFQEHLEKAGGHITISLSYTSINDNLAPLIEKLMPAKPEVIFLGCNYQETLKIASLLRKTGISAQLIGGEDLYNKEFIKKNGKATEGILFITYFHPETDNKITHDFVRQFQLKFKNIIPDALSASSYDSLMILSRAFNKEQTPKNPKEDLRDYLLSMGANTKNPPYEGLLGKTVFDKQGEAERKWFVVTVKNKKFVLLKEL